MTAYYDDALTFINERERSDAADEIEVNLEEEKPVVDVFENFEDISNDPLNLFGVKEEDLVVFQLNEADRDEAEDLLKDTREDDAECTTESAAIKQPLLVAPENTTNVECDTISASIENTSENAVNAHSVVAENSYDAGSRSIASDDDEIYCDSHVMPMLMSSMRNGLMEQDSDDISGEFPFKTTVATCSQAIMNLLFVHTVRTYFSYN